MHIVESELINFDEKIRIKFFWHTPFKNVFSHLFSFPTNISTKLLLFIFLAPKMGKTVQRFKKNKNKNIPLPRHQ